MKKVLLVLIAVLAMFTSFAQSTANYDFSTVTTGSLVEDANSNAIDMTSGATNVYGAGVDTYTASFQNLPFPFIFMGQLYTQFSVKPDGAIRLGSTLISGHSTTVAANTAFLSPMGADNATAPSVGSVEYKTVGSAPNRTLVVQWTNIRMNWNASSNTNYGTFQARLYEGTGVIEYVYGQMWNNGASALAVSAFISSSNTVGTVGAVETIATTPTYNATVTSATTTSMVANAAMANLNSAADGSRRVFTFTPPPAPAAPTALNFTGIGVTRMTLNWTDNSADEVGFGILRSTDDVTYTLVGSTGENATSFEATGLDEGTTYFWQVVAFNEGTFSSAAIGSEATVAAVPLTGTYTIDNTQPTSGNNFNSFAAAINALSDNGLGGAVIFDVTAGQTFIENLPAFTVTGTASNTITFQKNGAGANPVIQSTGTSATTDAVLLLNGVSYYTFDGIDLIQTGTAAADWVEYGIYVRNSSATVGSQNNTFKNMSITLDRSNTNSRGIYQNVAVAPTNATGANSDNKYYNLTIKNAFGGIYLLGNATNPDLNTEIGTTSASIYNIIGDGSVTNDIGLSSSTTQTYGIRTNNQSDAKIFNNIVSNVGNSGIVDGILVELFKGNSLVYNNKISGIANISTSSTSAASGIRLTHTTTGTHNIKVYNNFVSDITRGFTGTATVSRYIKGIYISGTGGNTSQSYDIDFNSVRLDGSGSPNTSSACFEIATTSGPIFRVRNNIFANFTSAQGATAKHFGYYSTAAATIGSAGSVLQYNDIYIPNDEGVSGHAGRGNTANYNTVANLEAGFTTPSGGAANNISANPIFASSTDLHAGSPALDGAADPANNTPWVITDIDDDPRNDPADIGADEFDVLALDMGAAALVGLDAATGCYTNAETVTVTITNFAGTDIDFSVNPVTVTTNVTGAATANLSAIVNAGTLASGASMNVDMSTTLDMSVAGTYTFNASTSVVGDGNASNDAMTTDSRIRIALAAGTAKASPDSYCVTGGTPTLSLTGHEGYSGIQWQESTTSMSGYTDIGGATTSPYTIGSAITQTMYYQAVLTCGAETATSTEDTVVLNNPEITSTTPASRCGVGTVDLAATTNASAINWYENPTGGTAIHTGTTFTTPVISENTTYYVAASSGSSTINVAPSAPEGSATATSLNTYPSIFTLTESITLNSIQVFSTTGTAITISLYNAAGTTQLLTTGSNPVVAASSPIINLGWNIEPGTYRIVATMTGNFYRDGITTPSIVYPIQLGTSGYISGYASSLTGTLTTGAAYYFLYNWSISTGCESARTPVTATINTPPAITASAVDEVICNGASTDLSVSSAHSEYTYTWTPGNHVGATYNVSPSSTTKYYVNAIDNSGGSFDGCANIDSVTVTVQPTITDIIATVESFCVIGGSSELSLVPSTGYAANSIQWQSSSDNSNFSDIGGANDATYTTPTISATTYYRALIKNGVGTVCNQYDKTIEVTNPEITSTTPASRCGTGTVDLSATSNSSTINWYENPSGGTPIHTGGTFTTPVLSNTTTYYAAGQSSASGTYVVGDGATTSATYSNPFYSLWSNTHVQHLITVAEMNAAGLVGGPITALGINITNVGTLPMIDLDIKIGHTSAVSMATFSADPVSSVFTSSSYMPTLGLNMMTFTTPFVWDGVSNIVIDICHGNGSSSATMNRTASVDNTSYVSTIKTHTSAATSAATQCGNTTTNIVTYSERPQFTFDGVGGCVGDRTPVTATINTPPEITASAVDETICNGSSTDLSVSSAHSEYTYTWTPGNHAGATYNVSPTSTTKYYVNAIDNSGGSFDGCANIDSVTVTVNPVPAAVVITPSSPSLCAGSDAILLTANGGSILGNMSFGTQAAQNAASTSITGYPAPFTVYYGGQKMQMLILASELSASGYAAGSQLTSIGFPVVSMGANWPGTTSSCQSFQVSIGTTSATSISTFQTTGMTQVVAPANFTPVTGDASVNTLTFDIPFIWDGTSNIVLETTFSNNKTGLTGDLVTQYNSPTPFQSCIVYRIDNNVATTIASFSGSPSFSYSARPDFVLNGERLADITWSPLTELFTDATATTAYTGTPTESVYAKPTATRTYTATATIGNCTNTGDITVVSDCSVPVTYSSFTGRKEGNTNLLEWTTATEANNLGFELQRSADGRSYSKLDFISSKADNGNSNIALSYTYNDNKPLASNNYYRLKQMDKDGRVNYSNVVLLKGEKATRVSITGVYPNPTRNTLSVNIASPSTERVSIVVTDISGKVLVQQNVELNAGDNVKQIDVSRLSQGTYLIKTICNNGCESAVIKFAKY
ncbi:MAG: T9SS type A sorting domain-containing protein [Chitinophagaceae bacterium]|nr:T9SS type A sorting domain-containing protein [Chitinophagaceae bacterium]